MAAHSTPAINGRPKWCQKPGGPMSGRRTAAGSQHPPTGPRSADEAMLAMVLTVTWRLITGRRLTDQATLLHDLPRDQLIDFWADDHNAPHRPDR
ncbi:hypothetical protein ACGFNU_34875 [Spirillospora sp. NPDC048911]|uniref:hypothetical protein n=1 Tax=Spirillospora sp. NPDC048911 TaxID=3364527 RepID=UPI0037169425